MTLYHGSTVEVRKPSLKYGRKRTDFGRGFYTTTLPEQAEHWAQIKRERANTGKAVVSVYEIDDQLLRSPALMVRDFHGVDRSWLDFVTECRKKNAGKHDYDLVFGPVANDNVFATVNQYENGFLNAEAAIAQLKAYKTYDQLSFHSKRVIDELRFVESYEVY